MLTGSQKLADFITVERRYTRSVNLERDFNDPESVKGYVVTERAGQALRQIGESISRQDAAGAWTLTGVYGTGKSAFAHFLASLFAAECDRVRQAADSIFADCGLDSELIKTIREGIPQKGFIRAVVTAQREPIENTLLRALRTGVNSFWKNKSASKAKFNSEIDRLEKKLEQNGQTAAAPSGILNLIRELRAESKTGLLIIIDEFGKCLEFAALNRDASDLYLLQQIKELPAEEGGTNNAPIFLLGLLHQAFAEYGYGLGAVERNEWIKIQGRFEEIPFTESARQMVHLIGQAINQSFDQKLESRVDELSRDWHQSLKQTIETQTIGVAETLRCAFPLHPLAALVLPQLCLKYAQNDRSLFTFLTGSEPGSLRTFLEENSLGIKEKFPLLKLDRLYDYFVDTAQADLTSKTGFQRWTEVKSLIDEHLGGGDDEVLRVLKTIGVLNLASSTGFLRAARGAVALAMCDDPRNLLELDNANRIISSLIERGIVTYRQGVDELRLWEGSDFDAEQAVKLSIERQRLSLAELLNETYPLRPVVAQRHSYRTGAIRAFSCHYFDDADDFENLATYCGKSDGLIGYWVSEDKPPEHTPTTVDGKKPFVLIEVAHLNTLRLRALELAALKDVAENAAELRTDGVARREVRFRLLQARNGFDDAFARSLRSGEQVLVQLAGKKQILNLRKHLNGRLSDLCDEMYELSPAVWNEIVNRQVPTSQGAKAIKQVITAMLEANDENDLGLSGFGPEVSVYDSVLKRTGIHRRSEETEGFGFFAPENETIKPVWDKIERFCLHAKQQPAPLNTLFKELEQPPFGVKRGLIPILFAAVFIARSDDTSIYKDGVFIPVLGAEHFELLVKNPARFSVKNYFVTGIQAKVFKELENILSEVSVKLPAQMRNKNLLGIVSPLLKFVRRLSLYTRRTKNLSSSAQSVRDALLNADEPDKLLFELLPSACSLAHITSFEVTEKDLPRKFRTRLILALKELSEADGTLLQKCRSYLHEAFGVRQEIGRLREDLRSRASYFAGRSIEPVLTRFVSDAINIAASDEEWLQNIVMGIADKPIESWTDDDVDGFALKLSDLARRFKHLEAIIKDNSVLWNNRAEARRVSLVRTDGSELHDIAWIDEGDKQFFEHKAEEIIDELKFDKMQQKALLAVLTEKILDTEAQQFLSKEKKGVVSREDEGEDETHTRLIGRKR